MVQQVRLKLTLQKGRLLTQISLLDYFTACLHNQLYQQTEPPEAVFALKPVLAVLQKGFLGQGAQRASQKGFGQSSLLGQLGV